MVAEPSNPALWASVFVTLLSVVLATYSWTRRHEPAALSFVVTCLLGALWGAASAAEAVAASPGDLALAVQLQAICLVFVPPATTWFILHVAGIGQWLTGRNAGLVVAPAVAAAALMATNAWHHLAWPAPEGPTASIGVRIGPVLWLSLGYSLALGLLKLVVLVRRLVTAPTDRSPTLLLLLGNVLGHAGFAVAALTQGRAIGIPFDVISVAIPFSLYAAALFGFHVLDPVPEARRAAESQMSDGMLVLDPSGCVVSANPAAMRMLGSSVGVERERPVLDRAAFGFGPDGRPVPGVREVTLERAGVRTYLSLAGRPGRRPIGSVSRRTGRRGVR